MHADNLVWETAKLAMLFGSYQLSISLHYLVFWQKIK